MSDYWLCKAGVTLFAQVNDRWPKRERASDGWVGDASHQASVSDHNPCWSCSGSRYGVVRAIDIDASLDDAPGYRTSPNAWRLANDLRKTMLDPHDGRISYIIAWDPARGKDFICSTNPAYQPLGVWREYTGDSHVNHVHVSFAPAGDFRGGKFESKTLNGSRVPERLKKLRDALKRQVKKLGARLRRVLRKIRRKRES